MGSENVLRVNEQLYLFSSEKKIDHNKSYLSRLNTLLNNDLDFHNQVSSYSSHNFHSFPAKFPPQLPELLIHGLTAPNDIVLDPMVGSGTTLLEAYLTNRKGIGFDIDPLALKISKVKTTNLNRKKLIEYGLRICNHAKNDLKNKIDELKFSLNNRIDSKSKDFLDYWFLPEIQLELFALCRHIQNIKEEDFKNFFEVVFSSVIITKSGGVSLALDLGHTRPHKTKTLLDKDGNILFGDKYFDISKKNILTKTVKSALEEFEKRIYQNMKSLVEHNPEKIKPIIRYCDSQHLCMKENSVDLIVTSPPYASNAIDYMRAHKFSLIWLGYHVEELTARRREYIGAESTTNFRFEDLPKFSSHKVSEVSEIDQNRGNVLKRYYSEMTRVLKEMYRVLKPQKAAIVVVGSSVMKGINTETHKCLAEIGNNTGFIVPHIGIRKLDRNKRMLPAGLKTNFNSQIQQRMHEEYVIGLYKPMEGER
jgi:DNA modification methylase